jgi:TPP-dependent pyruvate/acetoin dehydrogenase alpha subunit
VEVDGNDVMAVYEAAGTAIDRARSNGGPTLIECKTYRTVGHHEGDPGTDYRTNEELDSWKRRCPIKTFRARALASGLVAEKDFEKINRSVEEWLEDAVEFARTSPDPDPNSVLDYILWDDRGNR